MESIKSQKKKAYLNSEQYVSILLGVSQNYKSVINLKQIQLTWKRQIKTQKELATSKNY